jgi:hypothetical protein
MVQFVAESLESLEMQPCTDHQPCDKKILLRSCERLFHTFFKRTLNQHTQVRSAVMMMKVVKKLSNLQPVDLAPALQNQHKLQDPLQSIQCQPLLMTAPTCMRNPSMRC